MPSFATLRIRAEFARALDESAASEPWKPAGSLTRATQTSLDRGDLQWVTGRPYRSMEVISDG